jgi:hypothetical protein
MSIVGDGNVEVGEEYADITNLTPYSVDAVSNPATTKGFFESISFTNYSGFGSLNLALDYERMTKEDLLKEIAKFIQFISAVGEVCKSLPEGKTKEDITFEAVKNIPQGFYKAYRNFGKGK